MNAAPCLDDLERRITDALRQVPGASALIAYGSRVTPYADQYSDLDMQLVSAAISAVYPVWPALLEAAGPLEIAWPMSAEPAAPGYSVLFVGCSSYHKLDITVEAIDDVERRRAELDGVIRWTQEPVAALAHGYCTAAYAPRFGSVGHLLVGELMSAVRYVKARKRDHHLVCWRFARSKLDLLVALSGQQHGGWTHEKLTLTTWDYKALDRALPVVGAGIHAMLDWSSSAAMDRAICDITRRIVDLLFQKASATGEVIPVALVERHLAFVHQELGIGNDGEVLS